MAEQNDLSKELANRYSHLRNARGSWDGYWRDVSRFCYTESEDFWRTFTQSPHGNRRNQEIYDTTAPESLVNFASIMETLLTPAQSTWHHLRMTDPDLNRDRDVALWLEQVNTILFRKRYSARAGFQANSNETYMSIGSFGTGCLFIDERAGEGLRYKNTFIGDTYIDESHTGIINQVFRRFDFSNQQAIEKWGQENLPGQLQKEIEQKKFDNRHEYVHVVLPNDQMDVSKADSRGMPFLSMYIHLESQEELFEPGKPGTRGGFRSFPYACSRWVKSPNELYGRSVAMKVLETIRTLNAMAKDQLAISHLTVNPPLLLHDDGILGGGQMDVDLTPGGQNFGGVSADGRLLIQPMQTGGNPMLLEQIMEGKRNEIRRAFLIDVFQLVSQKDARMTASEALLRNQEKAALLGPIMGRQQSELLGPMIERELEILFRMKVLPEMPPVLIEAGAEGEIYDVQYDSPVSRLQLSEQQIGIDRTMQRALELGQFDNGLAVSMLDSEKILLHTQEANGAPIDIIKSSEEIQAQQQADAAAQKEAQLAQAAPAMAGAVKDLAQAQQIAQGA